MKYIGIICSLFLFFTSQSHAFSINPDAIVKGGAIQAVNMDMTMQGSKDLYDNPIPLVISHNTAQYEGGAVYVYASGGDSKYKTTNINILDDVTISHNSLNGPDRASTSDYYYGGAMSFSKYNSANTTMNINFTGNSINIENNGFVDTVYNGSSSSNRGEIYGGAVYIYNATNVNFNGNINMTGNKAELAEGSTGAYLYGSGGAMYFNANRSTMTVNFNGNITANNNTVNVPSYNTYNGGGAMYFHAFYSTMTVNFNGEMSLTGNTANYEGGAMWFCGGAYPMTVNFNEGSTLTATGNEANYGGAMFFFTDNTRSPMTVNFNGTIIANNNSASSGGAMCFEAHGYTVTMNFNGTITANNNIAGNGGAMYFRYGTVNFNGTVNANNNTAANNEQGGAMYFVSTMTVNFNEGSTITANNNRAEDGGAMYFADIITVNFDGTFTATGNTANGKLYYISKGGGAMCFVASSSSSTMTVNFNSPDLVFDSNTGTGSAIYLYGRVYRSSDTSPLGDTYSYLNVIFHKSPKFINQTGYPIYAEAEMSHWNSNLTPEDTAYVRIYNPPAVAGYVQAIKSRQNAPNAWAVVQKYNDLPTIVRDETTGVITSVTPNDSPAWQVIHDGRSYRPDRKNYDTTASWDASGTLTCINYTDGRCEQ